MLADSDFVNATRKGEREGLQPVAVNLGEFLLKPEGKLLEPQDLMDKRIFMKYRAKR